ncbi:unnamed protein product, partial [Amoebophrya sp. A25]
GGDAAVGAALLAALTRALEEHAANPSSSLPRTRAGEPLITVGSVVLYGSTTQTTTPPPTSTTTTTSTTRTPMPDVEREILLGLTLPAGLDPVLLGENPVFMNVLGVGLLNYLASYAGTPAPGVLVRSIVADVTSNGA